jgi:hypothetical protein
MSLAIEALLPLVADPTAIATDRIDITLASIAELQVEIRQVQLRDHDSTWKLRVNGIARVWVLTEANLIAGVVKDLES